MSSALLIIDLQQTIAQPRAPHDFAGVLGRVQALIAKAKAEAVPVVWVQHNEAGSEFERDTPGWQWMECIAPGEADWVVHKQSSDAFHHTQLNEDLKAKGVAHLVVCGYASEFCVDTTVRSATSHDFRVTLVADAHTTHDRPTLGAAAIKAHLNWLLPNLAVYRADGKPAIEALAADQVLFGKRRAP